MEPRDLPPFRTVGELRAYCAGRPDDELVAIENVRGDFHLVKSFGVRHLRFQAIDRQVMVIRSYVP